MGHILFHDYKSNADTLKIKVDFVFLIQSTPLPTRRNRDMSLKLRLSVMEISRTLCKWKDSIVKRKPANFDRSLDRVVPNENLFIECVSIPNRFCLI